LRDYEVQRKPGEAADGELMRRYIKRGHLSSLALAIAISGDFKLPNLCMTCTTGLNRWEVYQDLPEMCPEDKVAAKCPVRID
jgi:hypothetical protein